MIVVLLTLIASAVGLKYLNIQNMTFSSACETPSFRINDEAALACLANSI